MVITTKISGTLTNLSGTVQVSTTGTPDPVRIDYYVDNKFTVSRTAFPAIWAWDTTTVADGQHYVESRCVYKNGRTESGGLVTVKVFNSAPPPADVTAPTVPGSFAKTASTETSITTTWSASTDAVGVTGYNVYKNGVYLTTVTTLTYTFTGLVCGTSYSLSVDAVDAAGNKSAKSTISAATSACPAPTVPTVTSSIETNATVTQGDTWTVTTDPDSDLVEFWADGVRLSTDSSEPYTCVINLAPGVHRLALAVTYTGVRTFIDKTNDGTLDYAHNVTVVAAPVNTTPKVTSSNIVDGQSVAQGFVWTVSIDPTPSLVEFWADGVRMVSDSAAPFSCPINLSVGAHKLGLVATVNGVRDGFGTNGVFANITVTGTTPPTTSPLFHADFETGDTSQVQSNQAPKRIVATNVSPLEGVYSAKVVCGPEDLNSLYDGSPPRSEMEIKSLSSSSAMPFYNVSPVGANMQGKQTWITFYALLKGSGYTNQDLSTGWDFGTNQSWCIISQIESATGSAWPVYDLKIIGPSPGTLYLTVRGASFQGYPTDPARVVTLMNPVTLNTLLKFKIHHKWSAGSDGLTEVYINNVLKGSIPGPNMWTNGQPGIQGIAAQNWSNVMYLKGGIYRTVNGITHDSTIYLDNFNFYSSDPGNL